ncbi:MAG: hypothetical protein H7A45_17980 [Verrucomicrobiales bacterium]|nr:hypothetical protein [Verrucomicrobiales bacterium]MCP5525453.1 hypothetical protein [Verrucomicrobiales bacterium]
MSERAPNRLPWWLKVAYTLWLLVLVPADLLFFGPWQYLWFCHLGNLLLAVALWRESALIFSWQAVSLLLLDGYFTLDVLGRLLLGFHPIGGTEYIFDTVNYPFHIRAMAFFHMGVPVLMLYGIWQLGYDRRALRIQVLFAWLVLLVCYRFSPPALDINWVFGPNDRPQTLVPSGVYLLFVMIILPITIYLPTHWMLAAWQRRRDRTAAARDNGLRRPQDAWTVPLPVAERQSTGDGSPQPRENNRRTKNSESAFTRITGNRSNSVSTKE